MKTPVFQGGVFELYDYNCLMSKGWYNFIMIENRQIPEGHFIKSGDKVVIEINGTTLCELRDNGLRYEGESAWLAYIIITRFSKDAIKYSRPFVDEDAVLFSIEMNER